MDFPLSDTHLHSHSPSPSPSLSPPFPSPPLSPQSSLASQLFPSGSASHSPGLTLLPLAKSVPFPTGSSLSSSPPSSFPSSSSTSSSSPPSPSSSSPSSSSPSPSSPSPSSSSPSSSPLFGMVSSLFNPSSSGPNKPPLLGPFPPKSSLPLSYSAPPSPSPSSSSCTPSSTSCASLSPSHSESHDGLQIILPCALIGGLFIIFLFGLGGFVYNRRKKRRTMRTRGIEEGADSPQNPENKVYHYTPEDNEGQHQRIRGANDSDTYFPHPRRRPSDVPLLHSGHTPSTSPVPGFISGSDLNLGSASRSYTTNGEISDSTITPRATPISRANHYTVNSAIQIHVTKEQEQYSTVDVEIRPGSPESTPITSTLPTDRTDPPSSRLHFDLQRAESPSQTSNLPALSTIINDHSLPKPQYLDYFVASPVSSSPKRRLFSRFSLSSSSSHMSALISSSSAMSSGSEGPSVVFNQSPGVQTSDEQNVEESMLHATPSRSNSWSRQNKQEAGEDEDEERSLSVARFSPDSSCKTIYAI